MITTIVKPNASHVSEMVSQVEQFLCEDRGDGYANHFADFPFNRGKLVTFIMKHLHSEGHFIRVAIQDEQIIGGMMGYIASPCFSDALIAKELILYQAHERGTVEGLFLLINSFVGWAAALGVKEIQIANSTGYKPEKFGLLMKRKGFTPFETGYMKRS